MPPINPFSKEQPMTNTHSAYQEVGDLLAAMLENPHCPAGVRESVVEHLSGLYSRVNLTRPEVVRLLYPHLIAADIAAASGGSNTAQEAMPVATESELTGESAGTSETGTGPDPDEGGAAAQAAANGGSEEPHHAPSFSPPFALWARPPGHGPWDSRRTPLSRPRPRSKQWRPNLRQR
jgi:hypothetical protein